MMVNKEFDRCDEIENWDFSEKEQPGGAILIPTESATIITCYSWSAILSNDVSICNDIQYNILKDTCIGNYAKNKNDLSFCELISDEDIKESCLKKED